jgi:hypothetical protein
MLCCPPSNCFLRAKGITVRGTIDLLIATWCIRDDVRPLHADRDFEGFETHLGLKRWTILEVMGDYIINRSAV